MLVLSGPSDTGITDASDCRPAMGIESGELKIIDGVRIRDLTCRRARACDCVSATSSKEKKRKETTKSKEKNKD